MKPSIRLTLTAAACVMMAPAIGQAPPPAADEVGLTHLALTLLPAPAGRALKVSSPAFGNMADIPFVNTQYRGNIFPGLSWSKGPAGTKSYAVIMQDTDIVVRGDAILHWTMYNIPAGITALAPGMSAPPAGASYGPNIRGPNMAYMGPRTPPGAKHRYHLQVFALDTVLPADPATSWDGLKAAMQGHVLASGQTVGLGQADPTAPPRPAPAPATTTPGAPH